MSDKLKPASILIFVALVLLAPSIQDALSKEASKYVNDSESSHQGLPSEWNDNQVICVVFPSDYTHSEYNQGMTMINDEGLVISVNEDYNGTGACVGGFGGYTEGMDFMMDATRTTGGRLAVGYEVGEWGPYVHTIGGLNANLFTGEFNAAYWNLDHNGEISMVGIGDLVMSEGDVLVWSIAIY